MSTNHFLLNFEAVARGLEDIVTQQKVPFNENRTMIGMKIQDTDQSYHYN